MQGFHVSSDPGRIDLDVVERLLRASYWAGTRSREIIERSLKNSACFGLYEQQSGRQIGLMRAVTDYATFVWLCDVVIEPEYRGRGLGKWMLESMLADPSLRHVRRWVLATSDAHGFYRRYGFKPMDRDDRWMELVR